MIEVKQLEEDGIANMKDNRTLEQKYRDMKLQEVSDLYYGSDKARDTYAKDTPGQTPGVDHNPDFQKHDPQLAVDGVPEKGGMIKKPVVSKAIKKDASPVKFKSVIAEIADAIDENMSPEQRKKAAIWERMHRPYLEEREKKRQLREREAAQRELANIIASKSGQSSGKRKKQIRKGISGTKELLKEFKNGTSIALMIDQRVSEGIKCDFFGKEALTTTIPAQFIKKFNAEVVPINIERSIDDNFKIRIFDNIQFSENDSIEKITLKLNKILEKMIIANPKKWIWTHNRWKL